MRRNKRLSVKKERMEPCSSTSRAEEDHDLAYFIDDRVELMRQVFCALTPKEVAAMAPAAVRKHSNDDLEELCLEELLGISSKRLCSVLDGAEPPSDTESSSDSDEMVTIELDSSDDGSQRSTTSNKKKSKKRNSKLKRKTTETQDAAGRRDGRGDDARGGGAGLTVLELLELQARARALKAQLRATGGEVPAVPVRAASPEVLEVKAEPPLVVEISSDDDQECRGEDTEPTPPKQATIAEKKNSEDATDDALQLVDNIVNMGNTTTTTTENSSLQNNAQRSELNDKSKEKQKKKKDSDKNTAKDTTVQDNNPVVQTNTDKSSNVQNDKSKNNTTNVEGTAKKKAKTAEEKQGTSKKKKSKKNKKSTEQSISEDVAKKSVEPPVDTKVEPDDTIVIEDDEPEPPTQKSPIRPPSPGVARDTDDFTVYVPQQVSTQRRIQLDRNNVVVSLSSVQTPERDKRIASTVTSVKKLSSSVKKVQRKRPVTPETPKLNSVVVRKEKKSKEEKLRKKKAKDKKRKKSVEDRDEITLQLSDSEKMDLLEDLDRSALDKVTSSSDGSTESESDDDGKDQEDKASDGNGDEVSSTVPTQVDVVTNVVERVDKINDKEIEDMVDSGKSPQEVDAGNVIEKADKDRPSDTAIDSTTNENDISEKNVSNEDVNDTKDSSDKESNASTENESLNQTESVLINIEEINKRNININDGDTFEVSCINDIPIIPDDYNLKLPESIQDTAPESDDDDDDDESDSSSDTSDSDASDERSSSDDEAETTGILPQDNSGNGAQLKVSEEDTAVKVAEEGTDEKAEKTIQSDTDNRNENDIGSDKNTKSDKGVGKSRRSERAPSEEGELSDKSSSEVEAFEMKPEVVCISDDNGNVQHPTTRKKKKKKEKICKKHKKTDVKIKRDNNFYRDADKLPVVVEDGKIDDVALQVEENQTPEVTKDVEMAQADTETPQVTIDSDNVYEILELSDDSSCYEVEGVNVLSKEPTSEEIVALSAKIDEIDERRDVVTDQEIIEHEQQISTKENETGNIGNLSWKDRYLDSKKVKKVLTTSNILNAMRKKNIELKKKMLEAKNKAAELEAKEKEIEQTEPPKEIPVEEGSIEHYNTLQGSNKYVDPVLEKPEISGKEDEATENTEKAFNNIEAENTEVSDTLNENEQSSNILKATESQETVTKDMKKDAKQLVKMYKRLLKYNDINKPKDPNRKKKSKKHKKKKDGVGVATSDNT